MPVDHVNGAELYWERRGSGPRLLFCNGSGTTVQTVRPLLDVVAGKFDLLAWDYRGLGRNVPLTGHYAMADLAADAVGLLELAGWDVCRVFGVSFGGMVAQEFAVTNPERVERLALACTSAGGGGGSSYPLQKLAELPPEERAAVLLASVGPGCLTGWDRLLAAPVGGEVCAVTAWRLTPWLARARLAAIARRQRRPIAADEHVNWHIWGHAHHDHGPVWRSFLTEQRALVHELDSLTAGLAAVVQPVLLIADPHDTLVPVGTTHRLAAILPDARVELVTGIGHHLPRRAAPQIAAAIAGFLTALGQRPAPA